MPWRDDLDAEPVQRRIKTKIGTVDDAEDLVDALRLQHPGNDFAAADLRHPVLPVFFF